MTSIVQALNGLPAGYRMLVVIASILIPVGGGGLNISSRIDDEFDSLNARLDSYDRSLARIDWQMTSVKGRLDGQTNKNREQDSRIRALEISLAKYGRSVDGRVSGDFP